MVKKMRRVLPVGSRAGAGRQGTVHTRVPPQPMVLIICVWGRLARAGTISEQGRRGGRGGRIFWEVEPRETAAGWCVCCLCVHQRGKL